MSTHASEPTDRRPTVLVIGLDDHHRERIDQLAEERQVHIRGLLEFEDVREATSYDLERLVDQAEDELAEMDADVRGITTFWDFPSTAIAAVLCERRGLPTPGTRAIATCEHKYWSRLVQAEVAPDDVPRFDAVDPASDAADATDIDPPYWLKPIKAFSGQLGFHVRDEGDLEHALEELEAGTARLGRPFQQLMDEVAEVPEEVAAVPGTHAIAEGFLDGHQCTLEGHVHDGEARVHGVFDIHRGPDGSTFDSYRYPSELEEDALDRMRAISTELMEAIGFRDGPFNIEFFVDGDRTWILEINPRISQEHIDLMGWVDGSTNLEVMIATALGDEPRLTLRSGEHAVAGKWFHRHAGDALVTRVPTADEIADLEKRFHPCRIQVNAKEGKRLSELEDQEPHSTVLAFIYAAADGHDELARKFEDVTAELPIDLDETS